jgi:hypothetical protein
VWPFEHFKNFLCMFIFITFHPFYFPNHFFQFQFVNLITLRHIVHI